MRTKLQVNRDEKTQKIKSIIVNDKYEFKGDKKIYDVRFKHQELTDYPKWLVEPQMIELLENIWKS